MSVKLNLSSRLLKVASYVPEGARVIDVGTDHAYVPIWLALNRKMSFIAASDVNPGPLECARNNAVEYGVDISLFLSDGLKNCKYSEIGYDCVIICGMGGELISSILSEVPKSPDVTFILQPMTTQDKLRAYLSSNGYSIIDESIVKDGGKHYQIIVCKYSGEHVRLTSLELLCGRINLSRYSVDECVKAYLDELQSIFLKRSHGKKKGGEDVTYLETVLSEMDSLKKKGSK